MDIIADLLLFFGSLSAAIYCHVLQVKLKRLTTLENGMGGAIAVLSMQVDELQSALNSARSTVASSTRDLNELSNKANGAALRLEMLMASLHDVPEADNAVHSSDSNNRPRQIRHRARRALEELA